MYARSDRQGRPAGDGWNWLIIVTWTVGIVFYAAFWVALFVGVRWLLRVSHLLIDCPERSLT